MDIFKILYNEQMKTQVLIDELYEKMEKYQSMNITEQAEYNTKFLIAKARHEQLNDILNAIK